MVISRVLLLAASTVVALGLSGCNTARGFGADVEELGRLMQGKPKRTEVEVIEQPVTVPAESSYVQPQTSVETYPYQGGVSYPAEPVAVQPQALPQQDPSLGEVVPAKTIKEM